MDHAKRLEDPKFRAEVPLLTMSPSVDEHQELVVLRLMEMRENYEDLYWRGQRWRLAPRPANDTARPLPATPDGQAVRNEVVADAPGT